MDNTRERWWVIAGISAAWWFVVAVIGMASEVGIDGSAWRLAVGGGLVASVPWVPLTVAMYALCLRVPLRRSSWMAAVLIHLAGGMLVVLARATWIYALDPWIHWYPSPPSLWEVVMLSLQKNLFVYWLLVGAAHAVIYARAVIERERTAAQLEAALGRAELSALAATLAPHFLFNTLQAVAEMVHRDAAAADRMIVQLSAMLRGLLDDRRPLVPLSDELAFVRDYLALEQVRFGDQLAVRWDLAPGIDDVLVPRLSIQPLIENALLHGLWPAARPGTLVIAARRRGDALEIAVTDDGVGLAASAARPSRGHGLATVRARIDRLYPGRGELALAPRSPASEGAEARLVIPAEVACAS